MAKTDSDKAERARLGEMSAEERMEFLASLGEEYLASGLELSEMAEALDIAIAEIWMAINAQREAAW